MNGVHISPNLDLVKPLGHSVFSWGPLDQQLRQMLVWTILSETMPDQHAIGQLGL